MKKLLTAALLIVTAISLTACGNDEPADYDIPRESAIILNDLPYSSYLSSNNPVMTIEVERMGEMKLQLFPDVAPNTVNSIIAYIQRGDYENNEFHRVINDFMIQGGNMASPSCTIVGEMNNNPDFEGTNDLRHYRGVISMARVGGLYNSQTSQFFIVHESSFFLDEEYATFGGLISGFNILDFIAPMGDNTNSVPEETVVITNITIELNGYTPASPVCQ